MRLSEPWVLLLLAAAFGGVPLLLRRLASPAGSLPLADARLLDLAARRTARLRWLLALALVALLALTAGVVRRPSEPIAGLLASEGSTLIVLDVSASISDLVYGEIARTLEGIVATGGGSGGIGLVLFADAAAEALPPGTSAAELEAYIRFFRPKEAAATARPLSSFSALSAFIGGPGAFSPVRYPLSPWLLKFAGGTHISTGLALAREAAARDGGVGRILLLSDLAEADEDAGRLTNELGLYGRDPSLDLRIVALPPATPARLQFFERILDDEGVVTTSRSLQTDGSGRSFSRSMPVWFLALAGALALVLAGTEFVGAPLTWRRPGEAR